MVSGEFGKVDTGFKCDSLGTEDNNKQKRIETFTTEAQGTLSISLKSKNRTL